MEKENILFVRLKPILYNAPTVQPREYRIFNKRTNKFMVFKKPGVWVKVLELDKPLLQTKQWQERPGSPFVFDICTETEARTIDRKIKEEREAKRIVVEPSVDTADDMTGSGSGDLRSKDLSIHQSKQSKDLLNVNNLPFETNDDDEESQEEEPEEVLVTPEVKAIETKPKKRRGRPHKKR